MSVSRLLPFFLLATACLLTAAPRLFLSTPALSPQSEIELILDRASVPDSQVGKDAPSASWLKVEPPLAIHLNWKSPNVARILLDGVPAIGTRYRFTLLDGHRHLDDSPVPAGLVGEISSEPFRLEFNTNPLRYRDGYSRRTATILFRFNDDVDPAAAAPLLSFQDKRKRRIAARAWRPKAGELTHPNYAQPSWSQRFRQTGDADQPAPDPKQPCPNILMVSPIAPLPIGEDWRLVAAPGIPNSADSAATTEAQSAYIGDIDPFRVKSVYCAVAANQPRRIMVRFNHDLPKKFNPRDFLSIEPEPEDLKFEIDESDLEITGDLRARDSWKITVLAGIESHDGLPLAEPIAKQLEFQPLSPGLALPSEAGAQLAHGNRHYKIETVNIAKLHVRAKKLTGAPLLRALQGYRHYSGDGPNGEWLPTTGALPWELIAGNTLVDTEIELDNKIDTSREVSLDWDKLLPADSRYAALFLDIRGAPTDGTKQSGQPVVQAIVQLTDLGIGWKLGIEETMLYAFSCQTGEPLEGVKFSFFGEDAQPLGRAVSDAAGMARIPRDKTARHLLARLGKDSFATAFDRDLPTVGLWHFPVRYSWDPQMQQRRVFLFTDRSLYKPGETVQLKGIIRTRNGNAIEAAKGDDTRLIVLDPAEREILNTPIKVSENGSFDHTLRLPAETVGDFTYRFEFGAEVDQAIALENEDWSRHYRMLSQARFEHLVPVAEFRRNAFELTHTLTEPAPGATQVDLAIKATYYQGRPVASGKVDAWARFTNRNYYPDRYRDFLFGDHRNYDPYYWAHYFGYRDGGYHSSRSESSSFELDLTREGTGTIEVPLPETKEPATREVKITTEVADANQQTLTKTTETVVHPASVYAGIGRLDKLVRVGQQLDIPIVAVTSQGTPFDQPLNVEVKVTREVNEQVKIARDDGTTAVRNETREVDVSADALRLEPAGNQGKGTAFTFNPAHPGRHIFSVSGRDPAGRAFLTRIHLRVYGGKEYPWAYEDGVKIKLVPEKRSYKPGETARILVLSPIEGTALVTVEREGILRSFQTQLKTDEPVLEIPVSDSDAPNAFVSVLVVKGARDSSREFPEPQLRLGYCELTVENQRDKLAVDIQAGSDASPAAPAGDAAGKPLEFLPGDTVTLTGTVNLADGKPAAGAEVCLWAEDEGVLAVMGYDNPDPMGFFYQPRDLDIRSGTSLAMLLPESPAEQAFFNKGFWIGGGGWDGISETTRRDFRPCAIWAPALIADADGRFTATFTAPDTLTRYRVLATATHGASKFGAAESAVIVAKPLMLEPKPPRFALEGDTTVLPVTVQNASEYAGKWKVTLTKDGTVAAEEEVSLEAGKQTTLNHSVSFDRSGDSLVHWSAVPVSLQQRPLDNPLTRRLSDAVEHPVPVDFPMPLLRAHRRVSLQGGGAPRDLIEGIDAALRDGRGEVELELARSLLLEAGGAVDYLLRYPYGCVEQTTSALMPWFAVDALRPVVPRFAKVTEEQQQEAIRRGVDRLLQMQQPSGGFSYWPGSDDTVDWASSYAGLGLVLCKASGADVPDSSITDLCNHLSTGLRGLADIKGSHDLQSATRGLWVLALAGQPQEAYRNELIERLPELDRTSRCFLALAVRAEKTDDSARIASDIMTSKVPFTGKDDRWMRWSSDHALELLAWSEIAPGSDQANLALDRLVQDRSPYGGWRTTWVNSWALLGMASYASSDESLESSVAITVDTPDGPKAFTLNPDTPTASLKIPLQKGLTLPASSDGTAFIRVKLAAKPEIAPQIPIATNGMEVTRTWERVLDDGTTEALDKPAPGDLVKVNLRVTLPKDGSRYLVVEDRLPAIFETVNQDFASQAAAGAGVATGWSVSHQELRTDRAVFFLDWIPSRGTYTLQYLARCTLAGTATAPPAKVESMYDPENVALSASRTFTTK